MFNSGNIETDGKGSIALLVQSIGGGGGYNAFASVDNVHQDRSKFSGVKTSKKHQLAIFDRH